MAAYISARTPEIDRVEISRALAKALAFKQCGQQRKAEAWAAILVDLLACADILTPAARDMVRDN
jgi:hypothetical protein